MCGRDQLPAKGVYREVDPRAMLEETLIRMAISMQGYGRRTATKQDAGGHAVGQAGGCLWRRTQDKAHRQLQRGREVLSAPVCIEIRFDGKRVVMLV